MSSSVRRRVLRWCGTAAAGVVLLSSGGAGISDAVAKPAPDRPSADGCGIAVPSGSTTLTVQSGGLARTVIVHVPAGYHDWRRTPLVVNLHGSGTTAQLQQGFSGMDPTADQNGFLVAYPQGLIPQQIGTLSGYDWYTPGDLLYGGAPVPANPPDDAAFITALPTLLAQSYCVDPSRVFLTGFSDGGRLTSYLACHASRVFAADAPVAGLRLPSPCPAGRPVPMISFHGTADPVDPYQGHSEQYWTYSVPQAAQYWAEQDRCFPVPRTTEGSGYSLTSYVLCAGQGDVQLYTVDGEGHEWPGGPPLPPELTSVLGPQSDAVDANSVMWTFFVHHPMPRIVLTRH
ncbi:alpha/beta hydrolase family esterase [Amycolatopsis sp. NPDC049252]|uniref:alpha/beta hydrolase family esterase n=1 Tax=Amycolatopsis sp. NPDC049252 TaxID=3363933 RepID=UPI00371DDD3D